MKIIPIYDLSEKKMVEEKVYGGEWLDFAYKFPPLRGLISQTWVQKFVSNYVGDKKKSHTSKKDIEPFLKEFGMSLEEYLVPEGGFDSFNDFFNPSISNSSPIELILSVIVPKSIFDFFIKFLFVYIIFINIKKKWEIIPPLN